MGKLIFRLSYVHTSPCETTSHHIWWWICANEETWSSVSSLIFHQLLNTVYQWCWSTLKYVLERPLWLPEWPCLPKCANEEHTPQSSTSFSHKKEMQTVYHTAYNRMLQELVEQSTTVQGVTGCSFTINEACTHSWSLLVHKWWFYCWKSGLLVRRSACMVLPTKVLCIPLNFAYHFTWNKKNYKQESQQSVNFIVTVKAACL
jgi:hypothetical protein